MLVVGSISLAVTSCGRPRQHHRARSGRLQRLQEHSHPIGGDRRHAPGPSQRLRSLSPDVRTVQARQVKAELASAKTLPGDLIKRRQLSIVMG